MLQGYKPVARAASKLERCYASMEKKQDIEAKDGSVQMTDGHVSRDASSEAGLCLAGEVELAKCRGGS